MSNGLSALGDLSRLSGLQVFEANAALATLDEPACKHVEKPWARGRAYHRRVQKKWTKRFGMEQVPTIYLVGNSLFAHPILFDYIQKHVPRGLA